MTRLALPVLAAGHVATGRLLCALGLKSEPPAWRRIRGVGLRGEASKFAIPAFGLRRPADVPAALRAFLTADPVARYRLEHSRLLTVRRPTDAVDVVVQRFAADGTLTALEPVGWAPPADVLAAVVRAFNATLHLPETRRPQELRKLAGRAADRLLAAACLTVADDPPADRFQPPDFLRLRTLGDGMLAVHARPAADGSLDLWVQAHRVGTDGVPLQELLARLEAAWGCHAVSFPDLDDAPADPVLVSAPGEREVWRSITFHDFEPLLARRRELAATGVNLSVAGLLLRCLGEQPEFAGVRFATTVDVPATADHEREVGFAVVRPDDCLDPAGFAGEMAKGVAAARSRTGTVAGHLQTAALLPPWLHARLLAAFPEKTAATFGTACLSVVKEAAVLVPPLSDYGFPAGFLAVGDVALPAAGGGTVGAVGVAGTWEQATRYPAVVRRALAACASAVPV